MNTIVILTALALEQQAVINKLTNISDYVHPHTNTIYKVGSYISNGNELRIVVGKTNQTNINAGIETERVIQEFNPTYLFFLGVAGGLKDVNIGDVVIGTDVIGYERGKAKQDFLPRPQFGFVSYEMEQKATSFAISEKWKTQSKELVNKQFHDELIVLSGTIASGEKVIGSIDAELYSFLKNKCSHALAVEMEGLGFLEACKAYPHIKTLLVRGISDLVEGKENSDEEGSQPYASKNVTEFLFGFIDYLEIKQEPVLISMREKMSEITTKLYPTGLRENEIWRRSGGDLSLVNLQATGKGQWIQALGLIENGGGGDIDFNSLITKMKEDFSNNMSLKNL